MSNLISTFLRQILTLSLVLCITSASVSAQTSSKDKSAKNGSVVAGATAAKSAADIEKTQVRTYSHSQNAHGYAAEDANATSDRLRGKSVMQTGPSNLDDNPDRVVNGSEMVQTKYCKNAYDTVHKSFNKHTGMYRYPGQQLEVPKDQYEDAVKLMEQKIREGKVKGISNPDDAKKIVRKGKYTYKQAVDIAKPGTFESVKYDAKTGAVSAMIAGGITFGIVFETELRKGASPEAAAKQAIRESGYMAGSTMTVHIMTKQMLRTSFGEEVCKKILAYGEKGIEFIERSETGKKIVKSVTESATGKQILTNTCKKYGAQLVSTTVLTSAGMMIVCTIPDVWRASHGEESWGDVAKNATVNSMSIVGGIIGAAIGAAAWSYVKAGVGTAIGGFVGGLTGGVVASKMTYMTIEWVGGKVNVH